MDRTVNALLADFQSQIDVSYRHSLPAVRLTRMLMNKAETDAFARQHGFLVPRAFAVNSAEGLGLAAGRVGFPCILKSQVRTVAFVEKAFLIESRDELFRTDSVGAWRKRAIPSSLARRTFLEQGLTLSDLLSRELARIQIPLEMLAAGGRSLARVLRVKPPFVKPPASGLQRSNRELGVIPLLRYCRAQAKVGKQGLVRRVSGVAGCERGHWEMAF